MRVPFVDLKAQYLSIKNEIDSAIQNVINDTAFIKGKYVQKFEEEYAEIYGVNNVISCANGTDAIYIALKALGISPGDEVITVANSWISTSETITQAGARVVFVDIDPDYYTIDTAKIEEKITDRTKAIIPVHLYGHPVNMSEVISIAKKHNLKVIEDCAQAHFAQWQGQNVGTFGDAGTFSFFPGKNLGAYGDAGCIVTNNDNLAEKMCQFARHGALGKHDHEIEGINSRLDGLQAAILSVKLKYIHGWTNLRIQHAAKYTELLSPNENIVLPETLEDAKHVFHLYVIRSDNRDELQESLKENGISTGLHYPTALPYLKAYEYLGHFPDDFPVAYKYSRQILSLPMYAELESSTIKRISEILSDFSLHRLTHSK
jgi:dTDP-4-amino-4,6-dideoxygalactose transaminase|tara:strand:+ start:1475 stop:2599 length:1125 start_codon:yes stop_codon:yes gene_type:complete